MARLASGTHIDISKKRKIFVYALYNTKLDAFYKKRKQILKEKIEKLHNREKEYFGHWTKDLKYARLYSRKADVTLSVRYITSGWKPDYYAEDLKVISIQLNIDKVEKVNE